MDTDPNGARRREAARRRRPSATATPVRRTKHVLGAGAAAAPRWPPTVHALPSCPELLHVAPPATLSAPLLVWSAPSSPLAVCW
eukprot:363461-Chlamydomonas_euryale.AAC.2